MDTALQAALRSVREDFNTENCERYIVALARAGQDSLQILNSLQDIYGAALKSLVLQELPKHRLPDAKFIIHDPALNVLDDYQGHAVTKSGISLGSASLRTEGVEDFGQYSRIVMLTSNGIYLFDRASTRRQFNDRLQKITAVDRSDYPVWDSRRESMEIYCKFADSALHALKKLSEPADETEAVPF